MQIQIQAVMQIVIEIGTGRNDPVDKTRLHPRDETGFPETGGSERSGKTHAQGPLMGQHLGGQ